MLEFTNRLKEIQDAFVSVNIKDYRLANLMSDLESAYQIPMMRKPEFEKANPFVIQLYKTVSESRSF
jgi:hypothetical protein